MLRFLRDFSSFDTIYKAYTNGQSRSGLPVLICLWCAVTRVGGNAARVALHTVKPC